MQPWSFQSVEPSASCANSGEDLISDLMLHVELIQAVISSEEWLKDDQCPSTVFPDLILMEHQYTFMETRMDV